MSLFFPSPSKWWPSECVVLCRKLFHTTHNDICFLFTQHLNNWWTASDSLSILSISFPEPIFESDTRRRKEMKRKILQMKCLFSFIGWVFIYDEVLHYLGNILSFKCRFIYFPSYFHRPLKEMESQSSYPPAYWRIKKRRIFSYPFKGVRNEEEPRVINGIEPINPSDLLRSCSAGPIRKKDRKRFNTITLLVLRCCQRSEPFAIRTTCELIYFLDQKQFDVSHFTSASIDAHRILSLERIAEYV